MNEFQNAEENFAFLQCGPCRRYPYVGYPKISEYRTCSTK